MKSMLSLAWKSLQNRRFTTLLTVLTIAISISLLLAVERIKTQTKQSFTNTISNTDLIVGARSGQVNLLLYAVFRIGNPTNNISWKSYREWADNPKVKWSVPLSLGDSHRGFRVLGTNRDYFKFYQYGRKQSLEFSSGLEFSGLFETVIGADVAKSLNYALGSKIILAHGISDKKFNRHKNLPFVVTGILAPTGTAVDKTVHVTLSAIEAIHKGWKLTSAAPAAFNGSSLEPTQITAFLLGLHAKVATFSLQRQISSYAKEPLSAIIPGIALHELWSMMSVAEQALQAVSFFVVVAGMLGMLSSLLSSLQARRREMSILRAIGARPKHIYSLLVSEAGVTCAMGIALGVTTLYLALWLAAPMVRAQFGVSLELKWLSTYEIYLILLVQLSGILIGFIPAINAYRQSLVDGMSVRV